MPFKFYEPNHITSDSMMSYLAWPDKGLARFLDFPAALDRDVNTFMDDSMAVDASITGWTIRGDFTDPTVATVLMLRNMNFTDFEVYFNDAFLASFTSYAESNLFLEFSTTTISSFDVVVSAPATGTDIFLGEIVLSNLELTLDRNPNFSGYKPEIEGLKREKIMADGGSSVYRVLGKFKASIDLELLEETAVSALYDLYQTLSSHIFVPFGTTSAWDGDAWDVNFIDDWMLKQLMNNDRSLPFYHGTLKLKETPL